MSESQSKAGLSGVIALIIAAAAGGTVLGLGLSGAPPASVDPYAAWCRGYSDGVAKVLLDQMAIGPADYAEGAPILDERCLADLVSDKPTFTAELRGPLLPDEGGDS